MHVKKLDKTVFNIFVDDAVPDDFFYKMDSAEFKDSFKKRDLEYFSQIPIANVGKVAGLEGRHIYVCNEEYLDKLILHISLTGQKYVKHTTPLKDVDCVADVSVDTLFDWINK